LLLGDGRNRTGDMRTRIAELSRSWRKYGHPLGFGVGIAQGYATLGRIGFEGRFDYAAIGPVSNLASRLYDEADDGEILLSQRAFAAIEDLVETEPAGDLTLKGFIRPVTAYRVRGLKG
jgi:adenylate cyclase